MRRVIITVATTGGIHRKEANPNLPEQPKEIAKAALESFNEGAAIAHIHARDQKEHLAEIQRFIAKLAS